MTGIPGEDEDLTTPLAPTLDDAELDAEESTEQDDEEGEPFVGFADEEDGPEPETPLIKKLRDQNRRLSRELNQSRRAPQGDDDPEPHVPERPRSVSEFDYDEDRFNAALDKHLADKEAHIKWQAREEKRAGERQRTFDDQQRSIEQQKKSLGVSDYEARAATVHANLSEAQIGVLINGTDNPAALIYALGRSPNKLDMIAAEGNLAKFAVMLGSLQKDLKMGKKRPPAPEAQVRGGAAMLTDSHDKELARLEKEAEKTGDRSKIIRYKRQLRQAA